MSDIDSLIAGLQQLKAQQAQQQQEPAQQPAAPAQPTPQPAAPQVDIASIVKDAVTAAVQQALASAPAKPTPTITPTPTPISDKGSPAAYVVGDWRRELAERPVSMTPAAKTAMEAELGVSEARRRRVEAARVIHGARLKVTNK